jgi:hypothetical protein
VTSAPYGPQPVRYEISVAGQLGETIRAAFPDMRAQRRGADTALTGALPDQAALYGVLAELEALGLELLEVRRLPPAGEPPPGQADPPDRTRRLHPDEGETQEDDYGTGSPT